ncbi:MAG TPA: Ig-like domain-containing protein, partial [Phycisphaerae bacterium]|nr:Ig-like domain-containing protein [Phycisphaerae bacterium]
MSQQAQETPHRGNRTPPPATFPPPKANPTFEALEHRLLLAANWTLAAYSNSGSLLDTLTNVSQPAFVGTGDADHFVRFFADSGAGPVLVGQGVVGSDDSDGIPNGLGVFEVTVEPLADGTYTISAELEDVFGVVTPAGAPMVVTIDTTALIRPTLDLVATHDTGASSLDNVTMGDPGNPANMDLFITAEAGNMVFVMSGGTPLATYVSTGADTISLPALGDGTYALSILAVDDAGNTIRSEELVLTVDTTAPALSQPFLSPTSNTGAPADLITAVAAPAFVGIAEPNALVRVFADSLPVGEGFAATDGSWEVTVEPLADGDHDIQTLVEDLAGNVSAASAVLTVTIDTAAPARPTIDLPDAQDTGASSLDNVTIGDPTQGNGIVDLTVTSEVDATVDILDGGAVIDTFVSTGSDVRTLTLAEGTHP